MKREELQDILNAEGFDHVNVIDKNNVFTIVEGEREYFHRNDAVSGHAMSGLMFYGQVYGDHRMIQAIADDMTEVFRLLKQGDNGEWEASDPETTTFFISFRTMEGGVDGGEVAINEKYAKDFDDDDRSWWSDRYKDIIGVRPTMSNFELIKWANENFTLIVTKSSDGSKIHKELIRKR
jgi:hypothetical protein